ncbi:MAG: SH3 domain-containing protein [Planctomycetaceae bacterium]
MPGWRHVVSITLGLSLLPLALTSIVRGESIKFPYEAVVDSDNVLVRSGPGRRYYPTGRLAASDRVVVHRHDPGGWCMIAPPEGSFSWIPADAVDRDTGTVTATSVAIRVGSRFDDSDRDVVARRLSRGETVHVLGQLETTDGRILLKIQPPRLEYRWVTGGTISPLNSAIRQARADDPYQAPPGIPNEKTTTATPEKTTSPTHRRASPIDPTPHRALQTLDDSFRKLLSRPAPPGSFNKLETDYRQLMETTRVAGFQSLVRRRLASLKRHRFRQSQIEEFQALTRATDRRDTAIRQAAHQVARPARPAPVTAPQSPKKRPSTKKPTGPTQPVARPVPQFSGAGIVRPIATGHPRLPRFVLVAPDGRLLTFLQPVAGINLAGWVNRQVGLTGPRRFHGDLQSDLLTVQTIRPVRLRR